MRGWCETVIVSLRSLEGWWVSWAHIGREFVRAGKQTVRDVVLAAERVPELALDHENVVSTLLRWW
jgi:hypothetical protein